MASQAVFDLQSKTPHRASKYKSQQLALRAWYFLNLVKYSVGGKNQSSESNLYLKLRYRDVIRVCKNAFFNNENIK
jgi:hypothetical protein